MPTAEAWFGGVRRDGWLRFGRMDRRTLLALGAAFLGAVVLVLASSSSPVRVWSDPPPRPPSRQPAAVDTETVVSTPVDGTLPPPGPDTTESPLWRIVAAVGLGVLVWLAVVVVSTWLKMLRGIDRRRRSVGRHVTPLPEIVDPAVDLDVVAARAALAEGPPRNAIVACWSQLERDAAAAGLARHPAETSVEYTGRVIGASSAERAPIEELGALYREARFSRHQLDDTHRRRAVVALERVAAALHGPIGQDETIAGSRPDVMDVMDVMDVVDAVDVDS